MSKKFALVKWCGGEDDKTYTPGVPVEWIREFDVEEYQNQTTDVDEVFAIEWRDSKKKPKGGWKLYDAFIIAVSDNCSVLTRRMKLLDGSLSPIKDTQMLKSNKEGIDERKSELLQNKAVKSLKLPKSTPAKKSKPVHSKVSPKILGPLKVSDFILSDKQIAPEHEESGVLEMGSDSGNEFEQTTSLNTNKPRPGPSGSKKRSNTSGGRHLIVSDSEDDDTPNIQSVSNASGATADDATSSTRNVKSIGTKMDIVRTNSPPASPDHIDESADESEPIEEIQQPGDKSCNNRPPSYKDVMDKLAKMDEKIDQILSHFEKGKGQVMIPSSKSTGVINAKCLQDSAFVEGDIEIGEPGSGVTVSDLQWSCATSKHTYTAMAISLLLSLFPLDVLYRSNYKGGATKVGRGEEKVDPTYTALDPTIIAAMKYAVKSKFPNQYHESGFGQAINGKLSSLRAKRKTTIQ